MNPEKFIAKWKDATLKERSAAQEHFIDLCRLLDEPTPAEADPTKARGEVREKTGLLALARGAESTQRPLLY